MMEEHTSTPHHGIAPAAESDATPQPPSAPISFWHLPYELRHIIILLACGPPVRERHTTVARSTDCTITMLSLLRSARGFYPVMTPLLYSHVRLTRPSALRSFQQTLAARPSLGRLVNALHIGPDEPLPIDWFPMRRSGSITSGLKIFTLDLGGTREMEGSWVRSEEYECDMTSSKRPGSEGHALSNAFDAAACDLNVNLDLQSEKYDYSGHLLGTDAWVVRVLEVQAALELYYIELQYLADERRQRSDELRSHPSAPYPRLKVTSSSDPPAPATGEITFYVNRTQILDRMASPGAPTDSFSHPLLFARSGLAWEAFSFDGDHYQGHGIQEDEGDGAEGIIDVFSLSQAPILPSTTGGSSNVADDVRLDIPDPLNLSRSSTATVGGNLALANAILALTPHVRSLSLTSFFEKVVAGKWAPPHQALESVTLGPVAPQWGVPLVLNHSALRGVKRLRIGGGTITKAETDCVAGKNGALPHLSILQWSMPEKCNHHEPEDVLKIVNRLLGVDITTLGEPLASTESKGKRSRASFEGDDAKQDLRKEDGQEDAARSLNQDVRRIYIEAHLHPDDIDTIKRFAPTDDFREAFEDRNELPGTHNRLELVEHADYILSDQPTWANSDAMEGLYDQGRTWWEEG